MIRVIKNYAIDGSFADYFCSNEFSCCRVTVKDTCPEIGFISTLVTDRDNRQCGHATRLMQEVETYLYGEGCAKLSLQVKHLSWMESWYKGLGYERVADGYDEGMVIMSKKLESI